jgi:hypothetical protein
VEVLSKYGLPCRINPGGEFRVLMNGTEVPSKSYPDGSIAFETETGGTYSLVRALAE